MPDAKRCPHRQPFTPEEIANQKVFTCGLINGYLGWMHGFSEGFCGTYCLAGRQDYPSQFVAGHDDALNYAARAALISRLRDGRSDTDPTNPWRPDSWQYCSRDDALTKAQQCGVNGERIAESLVVAVERGLSGDEAIEMASSHGVVS